MVLQIVRYIHPDVVPSVEGQEIVLHTAQLDEIGGPPRGHVVSVLSNRHGRWGCIASYSEVSQGRAKLSVSKSLIELTLGFNRVEFQVVDRPGDVRLHRVGVRPSRR